MTVVVLSVIATLSAAHPPQDTSQILELNVKETYPPIENIPTLEDLLAEVETCRTDFTNFEDGHQKNMHKILGHSAHIGHAFERDDKQWREFVKNPFWQETKKRYRPKRHETKRSYASFVIRYVLHAHNGALGRRAWKYGHDSTTSRLKAFRRSMYRRNSPSLAASKRFIGWRPRKCRAANPRTPKITFPILMTFLAKMGTMRRRPTNQPRSWLPGNPSELKRRSG